MRNSKLNPFLATACGAILGVSALAAPMQAQAARLPGTCDVIQNTACSPTSVIGRLIQMLGFDLS